MPLPGRIFAGDEELGKKNDDYRSHDGTIPIQQWPWMISKPAPRIRRKRVILGLIAAIVLYLFFKNIPTDLGPDQSLNGIPFVNPDAPTGPPPRSAVKSAAEDHYFNGQIRFYSLAASLQNIARTMGYREVNKNVLFAVADLQSASRLMPMACEMARWNRNTVHFVFMGRDSLPINDIHTVNGIAECNVYWHDARPDYSQWSSDFRMEASVNAALGHIHSFMHPQVYIVDEREEAFFMKQIRAKGIETGKSIVELPIDAASRLMWITRLDSGSLRAWATTYVDIVIHALPESSGSLIRLLKSIEAADYFGIRRPHLTVELPEGVDPPTMNFLQNLVWPPLDPAGGIHKSQVTIRRRVLRGKMSPEEASAQLVESFYPARPRDSHVLLLSPQVELSPLYYHWLFYNILEYKYSSYGSDSLEIEELMGISLELPSLQLDDLKPLVPPSEKLGSEPHQGTDTSEPPPFLWQAPNGNAALYFGDKWMELHSYLTQRISANHANNFTTPTRPTKTSPRHPAWLGYILELMRIRGYSLLYPSFSSDSIATVHNELYQPPRESMSPALPLDSDNPPPPLPDSLHEAFTANPNIQIDYKSHNLERPVLTTPLLSILPNAGDLPELATLPLLAYSGEKITPTASVKQAKVFADNFRRDTGRCHASLLTKQIIPMRADDLFCFDDEETEEERGAGSPFVAGDNSLLQTAIEQAVEEEDLPSKPFHEKEETKAEFQAHLDRQGRR